MGLTHSAGRNNDHLVDLLLDSEGIKSPQVELAMRLADRGDFLPREHRRQAYKDSAWRSDEAEPGYLHLSAPCIYANALEHLDLKPGLSFLNIGSGTGYLSSMVGFIIGEGGINHGIELYTNVVQYAEQRVEETLLLPECSAFSWGTPEFYQGNGFQLETEFRYDRIYCGAQVPDEESKDFVTALLRVGGLCIMPYEHDLQRIKRVSEDEFHVLNISAVSFAHFILPDPERPISVGRVEIGWPQPKSLLILCREKIRQAVRQATALECPLEMRSECEKKRLERADLRQQFRERRERRRLESQRAAAGRAEQGGAPQSTERADAERAVGNRDRIRGLVARGGDMLAALHRRVQRHQDARRSQVQAAAGPIRIPPPMPPAAAEEDDDDEEEDDPDLRVQIIYHQPEEREQPARQQPRTSGGDKERVFRYVTVERLNEEEQSGGINRMAEAPPSSAPTATADVPRREGRDFSLSRRQISAMMNRIFDASTRRNRNEDHGAAAERAQHGGLGNGGSDDHIDLPDSASSANPTSDPGADATSSANSSSQTHHKRARDDTYQMVEESERELKRRNMPNEGGEREGIAEQTGGSIDQAASSQQPPHDSDSRAEYDESAMEQMDGVGHACDEPIEDDENNDVDGDNPVADQSGPTGASPETSHDATTGIDNDTRPEESENDDEEEEDAEEEGSDEGHGDGASHEPDSDEEESGEEEKTEEPSTQALSLRSFHEAFLRRIDELPISERMKSFLKYSN